MIDYNHFSKSVIGLVRKANEDSIGSISKDHSNGNGSIHIVCDGMGGHVGGATASQTAIKSITEFFKKRTYNEPVKALRQSIEFANSQIFSMAENDPSLRGMGTTIVILLIKEDKIYIAHVGDSRVYLFSDNTLYRLTKDHSFVQKLVDAGQIDENEAENHPRKNELTRALGISNTVQVEVTPNPILTKKGDKFLLCSDGLCGLVNDPTLANALKNTSLSETVNDLISLAENAGGHDNISVDLIEILKSTHKKSVFNNKGGKSIEMTATQVVDPSKFKKKFSLKIVFSMIIFLLTAGGAGYFAYNEGYLPFIKKKENVAVTKKIDTEEQKIKEEEAIKIAEEQKEKEEEAKKEQARKMKELEDEKDEEKRKKLERELREAEEKLKIAEEERIKAEEDALIAEQERIKAEKDARIAEQERVKAEEDARIADQKKLKAEEDARIADQEKLKAEEDAQEEKYKADGYEIRYDWDSNNCSEEDINIGNKILFNYSEENKEINRKYIIEIREIQKLKEEGWEDISDENNKEYNVKTFFDPKSIDRLNKDKLNKKDIGKILECSNNTIGKKTILGQKKN